MLYSNSMNQEKYKLVSLFAGAGGLDMGFELQGFKTIWANDIDPDSCNTHKKWSNTNIVCGDINNVNLHDIPQSDVIAGGFPCQGFSLAGPRKLDDKRNSLYRFFVRLVDLKQPKSFIAENVKGILTLGNGSIIEAIIEDFSEKGYYVYPNLVNAADYCVPQDRWRVFLIGFRKDLEINQFKFPLPKDVKTNLYEALEGLPVPKNDDICKAPFSSRYMSRNRKRCWNEVSYTIPAMSKQVPLHPSSPDMIKVCEDVWTFGSNGNTRRLSWQEAAAIQTFPRDMFFYGNLISKYKQIGNAVPVRLSEVIAKEIYELLTINKKKNELRSLIGSFTN